MWRFSCFGGRFFFLWLLRASERASAFVMTAHRQDTRARTEFSSCLMPATAFAPPLPPPLLPHAHAPHSLLLLIISFIITCRVTRAHLSYDLQQTANASYSAVSCCRCTVLRYTVSLYPLCTCPYIRGILVYRTLNPLFCKASGSSEEV